MYSFNAILEKTGEVGYVEVFLPPIIRVSGLPGVKPFEVVLFESGELGFVLSMDSKYVEVLLLSNCDIRIGTRVVRLDEPLGFPVSKDYMGTTVDSLGRLVYESSQTIKVTENRPVDIPAPLISKRSKVLAPLHTGVTIVDLLIPLGKGQRELIIGDRKTGKTEFILQTLLSQARAGTKCIYAAIGKRGQDIKKIERFISDKDIKQNTTLIVSTTTDPLGMIYLTPYAAMTLAEYFRDQGDDVLLILDDLTTHAKFYREISLINKKFPGRSSYPGDIFYTHARLLERAGNFICNETTSSITCLPIADTTSGDISGYIQTNLMSITDGHIFFDTSLFEQGRRPAINNFLSVTRVGRQTQTRLHWGINRELNSFLTLLENSKTFAHFGTEINEGLKATMAMGDRLMGYFDQPMGVTIPPQIQIITFCLIWIGGLNDFTNDMIRQSVFHLLNLYETDANFKNKVDDLLNSCSEFNELLGKLSTKSTAFLDYLLDIKKVHASNSLKDNLVQ